MHETLFSFRSYSSSKLKFLSWPTANLYFTRDIYISLRAKNKRRNYAFFWGRYLACILCHIQGCTRTTFYALSIGVFRLGGTSRISEIQEVGLWSDFHILAVNLKKIYGWTRIYPQIINLKSESWFLVASPRTNCLKLIENDQVWQVLHPVFLLFRHDLPEKCRENTEIRLVPPNLTSPLNWA